MASAPPTCFLGGAGGLLCHEPPLPPQGKGVGRWEGGREKRTREKGRRMRERKGKGWEEVRTRERVGGSWEIKREGGGSSEEKRMRDK